MDKEAFQITYYHQSIMFPLLGPGLLKDSQGERTITHHAGGTSADWWVLTAANTSGTNGLTCLAKHGELEIINFWSHIR
jgi:hypothetical protein